MGGFPCPFALRSSVLPSLPVPIYAECLGGGAPVQVVFDQALTANPALDTGNWIIRYGGFMQIVSAAAASGTGVVISRSNGPGNAGPDVVSFAPPPDDLLSAGGSPVAAFANFPITTPPP
jgi:hypothetical protein